MSPLRAIAALEAGIAILGILIPLILPFVQQAYVAIVGYGFGAVLLRAAVCALILTPPTMLMGATLPVIARNGAAGRCWEDLHRQPRRRRLGTVIAGFYLLRVHDVFVASGVAIAINVARGAALVVSVAATVGTIGTLRRRRRLTTLSATAGPSARHRRLHFLRFTAPQRLSGFTALGAEVVWTRQLSLLFGASVYTFSLILATFLGGLAIGGSIGARVARRTPNPAVVLGFIQLALAVAIAAGAWLIVNALPQCSRRVRFFPRFMRRRH